MVHFVGAGSGAADLITVRGAKLLGEADVVIYAGSLVNPALLDYTKPGCEIHDSAKLTLEEVIALIEKAEAAGKTTVRLHTGDSSIYGAVREQFDELEKRGITYDVCPGVSAFCGAAAALRAEYTLPDVSQTVIITRAPGRTPVPERESIRSLAAHQATMVLFLSTSLTELQIVIGALLAALVQYVGTVAVHHDADGVHGAHRLRHNGGGEDHRRDGDHGDGADRGMIVHDVVHLPQGRGTQGVTAAGHQPSAAEGAPVGPDVGSDGVPGPGKAVAHCAHGADQGPSHDVGHIVDGLAHRDRRDAAPRLFRLQALRLCDDCLFHSTSQYSRPGRCSNRADNKN